MRSLVTVYLHDRAASDDAWRILLARARGGRVHAASNTEARARRGLAAELRTRERSAKR